MSEAKRPDVTRRDFGKMSAAAGFAVLTGGASGIAPDNVDTLKVGLIGCGGRGSGAAQNMLEGNPNVKVTALADLFADRVDGTLDKLTRNKNREISSRVDVDEDHKFVGWDAYKEIVKTDIDILIVATIPYSKPQHVEAGVEAGKHIFTEKPIAVDPVGVRRFMAAVKKHKEMGLSLCAGTQRRHQKEYIETIEKIHNGEIGEVVALRAYWCGGLPWVRERKDGQSDMEYRIRNWINYCWTSGDNIVEQHVHNLDVGNWVMNAHPISVFASGGRNWKPNLEKYGDLYDHFSCDFEYEGGVHMTSMSRHWDGTDGGVFEEAIGTKGRSSCDDMGKKGIDPYVQEHIDLVNSIQGTGPKYHEGIQVAESTMTAIIGRMSAYTGERLKWDEALNSDLSIVPPVLDFEVRDPVLRVPVPVAQNKIR